MHRLDGVAPVKDVRAPAPHVGSLQRPQCSSCVLLLDAKRAKCTWDCEKWDEACWQHVWRGKEDFERPHYMQVALIRVMGG